MSGAMAAWLVVAAFAWTLLAGAFGVWVGYGLGLDRAAADEADELEARVEGRHRHRPAPPVTLTHAFPRPPADPEWSFFGGAQVEPQPGPAEYELLTRTAESWPPPPSPESDRILAEHDPDHPDLHRDETPSAFTRRMAREVEAMIAGWEAQGNYDRHMIQARP